MLTEAAAQGVTLCVATPHCVLHGEDGVAAFLLRREKSFATLHKAMQGSSSPMPRIVQGAEVYMDHNLLLHEGIEQLSIEGTNCVLVEFPMRAWDPRAAEWLYSMTLRGMRPVIAHIDRYSFWQQLFHDTAELDVIYQFNAESLLSFRGRRILKKVIQQGRPYLIASDMHNTTSRPPILKQVFDKRSRLFAGQCDIFAASRERALVNSEST